MISSIVESRVLVALHMDFEKKNPGDFVRFLYGRVTNSLVSGVGDRGAPSHRAQGGVGRRRPVPDEARCRCRVGARTPSPHGSGFHNSTTDHLLSGRYEAPNLIDPGATLPRRAQGFAESASTRGSLTPDTESIARKAFEASAGARPRTSMRLVICRASATSRIKWCPTR